jgi:hypothetical protein
MKSNSPCLSAVVPSPILLASLYGLEFSALITAMGVYKKGERLLQPFLMTPAGIVLMAGVALLVISVSAILLQLRNSPPPWTKWLTAHLVLNLCSVAVMLAAAEGISRIFAVSTPAGPVFANTLLLPRSWQNLATINRAILAKVSARGSYFVYDNLLGWTVGRSRRSENGFYLSSVEGIRSPRVGMTFEEAHAKRRIAIVGDSFTFGLEVRYEDTWGYMLEQELGSEFQVLNFGVDGYGIDQAYMRYERDPLLWHPDVVILSVINDDFRRTIGVYGFLTFPNAAMPFSKPRFVIGGQGLVPLNLPLLTPDSIFAKDSITELPFIEYDGSFQRADWEWHFYDYLYSFRFLFSRFPRWPVPRPSVSDEAMRSINGELLRSFVRLARWHGSTPIVVYFPARSDFFLAGTPQAGLTRVAHEVFQAYGIRYLDMTDCVSKVNPPERFVTLHYSPVTNAAIAKCLVNSIGEALRG